MEYEKIMYEERQTFLSMHGGKPDEETGDDDSLNDTSDDRFREIVHRWHSPRKIATNIAEITSGQNHILLRKTNGTVIGCGANFAGELGIPNKGNRFVSPSTPARPLIRQALHEQSTHFCTHTNVDRHDRNDHSDPFPSCHGTNTSGHLRLRGRHEFSRAEWF